MIEKRDCLSSLLEQKQISLFYRNSHKAILNPHQHGRKTKFFAKVFWVTFLQKRDGTDIKLWHGVVAATAPGVATEYSFKCEPGAFYGAIFT